VTKALFSTSGKIPSSAFDTPVQVEMAPTAPWPAPATGTVALSVDGPSRGPTTLRPLVWFSGIVRG
jgi:hypothetical protein